MRGFGPNQQSNPEPPLEKFDPVPMKDVDHLGLSIKAWLRYLIENKAVWLDHRKCIRFSKFDWPNYNKKNVFISAFN